MQLKTDSPIQHQQTATSHLRPSPERLEAQIKSINCSQSQLFRMVLDRNEELVVMYRTMVDKHQESEAQLKVGEFLGTYIAYLDTYSLLEEKRGFLESILVQ